MKVREFILSNQKYFEDYITRSTYHSNRIEGNTLSYAETYAILFNDNAFSVNAKPGEIYEAINHKYAFSYVLDHAEEQLNQQMIKDIGILINKNISDISGYRNVPVLIQGAEHIPPSAHEIHQAMMYFINNYYKTDCKSIYQKIAYNHIQFERIHPFEDGNGRTGRLLINYELIHNNMLPIVIPEEQRTRYFKCIAEQNTDELSIFFQDLQHIEKERVKSAFINIADKTIEMEI
ncbi:Fic family protein [Lacrimispora brassicae]